MLCFWSALEAGKQCREVETSQAATTERAEQRLDVESTSLRAELAEQCLKVQASSLASTE